MKTSFYGSKPLWTKSIKDWNSMIDEIHFTHEDFMEPFEVIKKQKIPFCDKTTLMTYSIQPKL